jgi:hypothetical protein
MHTRVRFGVTDGAIDVISAAVGKYWLGIYSGASSEYQKAGASQGLFRRRFFFGPACVWGTERSSAR